LTRTHSAENVCLNLLGIYLNDQLALGIGGRELARRAQRENAGTDLGAALERVAAAIAEDLATLEGMMASLGIQRSRVKTTFAVAAERVGRLKPNGVVRGYSPLSRFTELDVLALGLENKKALWANLRDLAGLQPRVPDVDFDALIERAQNQRDELEPFRVAAGRDALSR
jgi:hypothetical protein